MRDVQEELVVLEEGHGPEEMVACCASANMAMIF